MPEAMKQIRKELGSDAVILNSKVIKSKGFLGLFKKNSIEVIAAADPNPPMKKNKSTKTFHKTSTYEKTLVKKDIAEKGKELAEVKREHVISSQPSHRPGVIQQPHFPEAIQKVYDYLLEQEVEQAFAQSLAEALLEKYFLNKKQVTNSQLKDWLLDEIKMLIKPYSFGFLPSTKKEKVIFLVGPTGVGKTTTIAKLAAQYVMQQNKKIALITMDTYRIGAIDQLKTYSKIMDIPIEVAYNYDDFVAAREKFANFDIIFVDTAGRNYKQVEFIKQLQENIDYHEDDEMYLVLSATTKYKEMIRTFEQFKDFSIHQVILTKMDEILEYGSILNIILQCQVGIACMTNGQDVPDDLIVCSKDKIASMIVGDWNHA